MILIKSLQAFSQPCDASTPSYSADLTGKPGGVWVSPQTVRTGLCCGLDPNEKPPIRCVEFWITLDENAQGIRFEIASGAIPPGALGYQINCGPYHMVGENICLDGTGPHRLTFCKPGNNPNTYAITSIPKPGVSPPVTVSDGCSATLSATGFEPSSITWTSVPFSQEYNDYLSCTSGCTTTTALYKTGAPPYIDYQVSGIPLGGCTTSVVTRITRVYFVNDKLAEILPKEPTICYGGTSATLTAYGSGGAPPYKYLWSNGATTQSITVGEGTFWVHISDTTSCPAAADTVTVIAYHSPIFANAGPDLYSCANNPEVNINASVQVATGGKWTGGSGTFIPSDTSLTVRYIPSASEITAGSVTLTLTTTGNRSCPAHSDQMTIFIAPSPVVNAGSDITVCANNNAARLSSSFSNAGGVVWSGGSGQFTPGRTSLTPTYIPSDDEVVSGTVLLTLTTTGNGNCIPVSDQMQINITPAPVVSAGPDITVCANNNTVPLNGSVTVAAGGTWSGGNGVFSPGRNALNTSYQPSLSEIESGSVTLTLTSTGNGLCNPVSDEVVVSITPAPTINAGPDRIVCANNADIILNGSVTVAGGVLWSGGTGTFSPSANVLNATYSPSSAEIISGFAELVLTSTNNGQCNPVQDKMIMQITPAPEVNTGPDIDICANNARADLHGTVTVSGGLKWNGGTGTFFPNDTSPQIQYTPSAFEINSGSVTLMLVSTNNGNCLPVFDEVLITITPSPVVDAGEDRNICANSSSVVLSGTVQIAGSAFWSSSGTGEFVPSANDLNASYIPSPADTASKIVVLTLTSADNGKCIPVSDNMQISIRPMPVAYAGPDMYICADAPGVAINGNYYNSSGASWTSGGTGIITPSADQKSIVYLPSANGRNNGTVTFTYTTTGNGICPAVQDQMILSITTDPALDIGPDISICKDADAVALNATYTVASGVQWNSSGSGSFAPDRFNNTPSYIPSVADRENGSVTITAVTTGNGTCNAVTDQLNITFTPVPVINAGDDKIICEDNAAVSLSASVSVAEGGSWIGGSGSFQPDRNNLTVTYIPSSSEILAGSVNLSIISTGNGTCKPVTDNIKVIINKAPKIDAGNDQKLCGDVKQIQLNADTLLVSQINWTTTGSGNFVNGNSTPSIIYNVTEQDTLAGSINFTITASGMESCMPVTDNITVFFAQVPEVNAGPDITVCKNTLPVYIRASGTPGKWTGGTGSYFPNDSILNVSYYPDLNELNTGSVQLTITSKSDPVCPPASDEIVIFFQEAPVVSAGDDVTVCADTEGINLNGTLSNVPGAIWTGNGSGQFIADARDLSVTYIPSPQDLISGTVNIILISDAYEACASEADEMQITITPAPEINAGFDRNICADAGQIVLNGTVNIASGGTWNTTGTGSFNLSVNDLITTYIISDQDTALQQLNFQLVSTGNGNCKPVTDEVTINIFPAPVVFAGNDISICRDVNRIQLSGTVIHAGGGIWSSNGSGIFSPDAYRLNPEYFPSANDKTAGNIVLTLTSDQNGLCNAVSDNLVLQFTDRPTVNAGPDQSICADTTYINLNAEVTIASGVSWSSSGTGIFEASTQNNTKYYFSSEDLSRNNIFLYAGSTGNGTCFPVHDTIRISIAPAPLANAGSDKILCADTRDLLLSGIINNAGGGTWQTEGTGSFEPGTFSVNTIYKISDSDTSTGNLKFTLTTTGNGLCKPVTDTLHLIITPVPVANPGTLPPICEDSQFIPLNGSVAIATGGTWSSSGIGTFISSASDLNASYFISENDRYNKKAILTLTTTGNGLCKPVSSQVELNMDAGPIAFAGENRKICADAEYTDLTGSFQIAGGAKWSSTGTGYFVPDENDMNAKYFLSVNDTASRQVTIYLETVENGLCSPAKDSVLVEISPAPIINSGNDKEICKTETQVQLNASVYISTGATWITRGSGSFLSNGLNATYQPSIADKEAGKTILLVTSTGNGLCKPVTDTLILSYRDVPALKALTSAICADETGAPLQVSFVNAGGVVWTTDGTGNFNSDSITNPVYFPSANDFNQGHVILTVTTFDNGACPPAIDQARINIIPLPYADAGPDKSVCSSDNKILLIPQVRNTTNAYWKTIGSGIFESVNTQLNNSYILSSNEVRAGITSIILTAEADGQCSPAYDTLIINIQSLPIVEAGQTQRLCPTEEETTVTATLYHAEFLQWTSTGTGQIIDPNSSQTRYMFSQEDISGGSIKLLAESVQEGICIAATDTVEIMFLPLPTANTGDDQAICKDADAVAFTSTVQVANSGYWKSDGKGIISDSSRFIIQYFPHQEDKDKGLVRLYFTTNMNENTCRQVTDSVDLMITEVPMAIAGSDRLVCFDTDTISLKGLISNATGGRWESTGNGTFHPDPISLEAFYIISLDEKQKGKSNLTLSTTGNAGCSNSDSIEVEIFPVPDIRLENVPACKNDSVILNAKPVNITNIQATYTWFKDNSLLENQKEILTTKEEGKYLVVYNLGDCYRADSSYVSFHDYPIPDADKRLEFCKESMGVIDLNAGPGHHFLWLGSGNTGQIHTINEPGIYYVKVFNEYNCAAVDTVEVVDICPPRVFVPNIFSPNKDGQNDVLTIYGKYFTAYKLTIFNRWGEVIYYSEDPFQSWDGTYLGEPMPNGVYPWILYYEGYTQQYKGPYKEKGSVTIAR